MASDELQSRVIEVMAELWAVPSSRITPDTRMGTLDPWDSMGHLMLVLQLEQELGVAFTPEQTERMHSVAQIVEELSSMVAPPQ